MVKVLEPEGEEDHVAEDAEDKDPEENKIITKNFSFQESFLFNNMPRHKSCRKINFEPSITYFKPKNVYLKDLKIIKLNVEELEALRLKNIENLNQNECSIKMETSQSTFQRILCSAYKKVSKALVEGCAIKIIKE